MLPLDIRSCLQYLGEITGEITNDDQLDHIFIKFCIEKWVGDLLIIPAIVSHSIFKCTNCDHFIFDKV